MKKKLLELLINGVGFGILFSVFYYFLGGPVSIKIGLEAALLYGIGHAVFIKKIFRKEDPKSDRE